MVADAQSPRMPDCCICTQGLKGRSGAMSNCSESPVGSSTASPKLTPTIWKEFAAPGCSQTDGGVEVQSQAAIPELVQQDGAVVS